MTECKPIRVVTSAWLNDPKRPRWSAPTADPSVTQLPRTPRRYSPAEFLDKIRPIQPATAKQIAEACQIGIQASVYRLRQLASAVVVIEPDQPFTGRGRTPLRYRVRDP